MNYTEELLREHTRINTYAVAKLIDNDPLELKKIIDIIYTEKSPLPQRASWVLATVNDKFPKLVSPYLKKIVDSIQTFSIDGIKRNLMGILASHEIPEKLQGKLVNICFDMMLSANETVVVKVHAMQVIANIAKHHPELKQELMAVIENQYPKNSAAFHARAKHVLKDLQF